MIHGCCLCGDSGVGKTALVSKIEQGGFTRHPPATIGAGMVTLACPDGTRIQIWDTAGQEKYDCIMPMYFRLSRVFFIVYDITREASFHRAIGYWYAKIIDNAKTLRPRVVLVGNKSDLELSRAISIDTGMDAKSKLGLFAFIEVSAKHTSREQLRDILHSMCASSSVDDHATSPVHRPSEGSLWSLVDASSMASCC